MKDPLSLEDIEKEINYYFERGKDYSAALELYKAIFIAQDKYYPRIDVQAKLSKEKMKEMLQQGVFLLSEDALKIDPELFKAVLKDVIAAIQEKSPLTPVGLEKLLQMEELKEEKIEGFLQEIQGINKQQLEEIIERAHLDERLGVDKEIIAFVLLMSLIPFYSRYAREAARSIDFGLWQKGYCPVCGQKPHMAKFRMEDGARILGCWLCRAQWRYPRLTCPLCENKDTDSLQFFYVEEDKAHRVYVCEKCKGYMKTTDAKMLERDVLLDIESIITMHLDLKAVKEGYRPPEEVLSLN